MTQQQYNELVGELASIKGISVGDAAKIIIAAVKDFQKGCV
jgi:hypothetical protein